MLAATEPASADKKRSPSLMPTRAENVRRLRELQAVRRQALLEAPRNGSFDGAAEIARRLLGCQCAIIHIVDREQLFEMSHSGESENTSPVEFTSVAGDHPSLLLGGRADPTSAADPRFAADLGFAFYAGIPLRTADGHLLGTLALLDPAPRELADQDLQSLKLLAAMVVDMIELRLAARVKIAEILSDVR